MKDDNRIEDDFLEDSLSLMEDKNECRDTIREECRYLMSLGRSLDETGQEKLASYITTSVVEISRANARLNEISGEELSLRVKETNQSVANTLSACLAGAKIGREQSEKL